MKYIYFLKLDNPGRKTDKYAVMQTKNQGGQLGIIKWFGRWRQYTFYPLFDTIWNKDCLEQVTEKITDLMNERKKKVSAGKRRGKQ